MNVLVVSGPLDMDYSSITSHETTRKRPSSRIRACWECKKRRRQSSCEKSASSSVVEVGVVDGIAPNGEDNACQLHIGERLGKLEQLFDKFMCRKPPNVTTTVDSSSDSQRTAVSVQATEKPFKFVGLPPLSSSDGQSLADGILGTRTWTSAPSIRTLEEKQEGEQFSDPVQRALVAHLPSQHDADIIFESSNGWMILNGTYRPSKELFVGQDPQSYALDMATVAKDRAIVVARTLLHLATCICALPPDFNTARLRDIWNLEATMENYVTTVTSLVMSSDEMLLTLPGLETLLLLSIYNINIANLRHAWLLVRRAMNLAHLMGFHRIVEVKRIPPVDAIESASSIWRILVDMDRILGLHLHLPFAADDYPIEEDNAAPQRIHRSRLATISEQVSELDHHEVTSQSYVQALALDEKLESMMKEQPKDFWDVPNVPPTARTAESFEVLERLMVQMWHFELKVFIHLPFLLRAPQESRFEYSKVAALQASRNIVMRWFALRNAGITQACCRFAELGVFIAAMTLTLDILIDMATKDKPAVQKAKGSDFAMICRVISEMEKLGKASSRERIAARSAVVLKKILSSLDPSKQTLGKARLIVPYFGAIELDYKKVPVRPAFDLDSDTAKKLGCRESKGHVPVFSFVQNALWPTTNVSGNSELDFDIILFDGLQDLDVDGNWVF
ncbi:hypothetical protein BU23DRAFT_550759 [Bimuria novae-zelandiae CBS 107.79]|uniref:Transcription factor domain-containing protein n=1 Tax=Bimuria novae-zelandiae CBS 107.79 TaxID=1447943 RepID=A0A6A5VW72_9PLEO|nr:hypothetical protein BU23DRAFT_550759 [Bimuria novae-zelandiae CBS 107.79]